MFKLKTKQYINILKQNKQLIINHKTIEKSKILKQEKSVFSIYDDNNMPQDALLKLDIMQKDIVKTYLTTLIETPNQIINIVQDKDVIKYENSYLTNDTIIQIPKSEFNSTNNFFKSSGIDFILSPFHILNHHNEINILSNSLTILIYNNILYSITLDNGQNIIDYTSKILTSMSDISSEDELEEHSDTIFTLFNEVHFLEMQQFLNDTISEFYTKFEDKEISQISIIHNQEILSDEQIDQLNDETMLDIKYQNIKINDYIDVLVEQNDGDKYSFITPRVKKQDKNSIILWGLLALLSFSIILAIITLGSENTTKDSKIKPSMPKEKEAIKVSDKLDKIPKLVKKEPKKIEKIMVIQPNHKTINNQIKQEIQMLFDTVPYNALLKELEIIKDSSTFVVNFVSGTNSLDDMQSKLKNIYQESQLLLTHQNKSIVNNIIENSSIITTNIEQTINLSKYKKENLLSIPKATKYLQSICIQNSKIKFVSKTNDKFITYNFAIKSTLLKPDDFFNFINNLNKLSKSININLPIKFSNTKKGLDVQYTLQYHQSNKDIKLKK